LRLVVDTSALVAIRLAEPETAAFDKLLRRAEVHLSIGSYAELMMVVQSRRGTSELRKLDQMVDLYRIQLEPVLAEDREILRGAVRDFARGRRQPPAVLNFGDLFAYALARRLGLPLLFKGTDFAQTDIMTVPH
jgi:ribonuclease VapC